MYMDTRLLQQTGKNKAYFEQGTNSIVLEVNPTSSAKAIRKVILDGAKTYTERIYSPLETRLKRTEHFIKRGESSGSFKDYMFEKKHYEELEHLMDEADNGKPVNLISGRPIEPKVVVRGFETEKNYSKKYFKELLDELRNDVNDKTEKREERYEDMKKYAWGPLGTELCSFRIFPTSHYEKKFKNSLRTYNALDYMSKKLEFREEFWPAPPAKNTATTMVDDYKKQLDRSEGLMREFSIFGNSEGYMREEKHYKELQKKIAEAGQKQDSWCDRNSTKNTVRTRSYARKA